MRAPCEGVPLPGGRPVPSGWMWMSQAASSDALIGFPSLGSTASPVENPYATAALPIYARFACPSCSDGFRYAACQGVGHAPCSHFLLKGGLRHPLGVKFRRRPQNSVECSVHAAAACALGVCRTWLRHTPRKTAAGKRHNGFELHVFGPVVSLLIAKQAFSPVLLQVCGRFAFSSLSELQVRQAARRR